MKSSRSQSQIEPRHARTGTRLVSILLAALMAAPVLVPTAAAGENALDSRFSNSPGSSNIPDGCTAYNRGNWGDCYKMRTGLNYLDSPQIDVLIMVPVSPTAERDMRIMRQAIEMWEGGVDYLAMKNDMAWLAEGVDFHISVDYVDLTGNGDGGEFTTFPIVDPEIVVIASNPVGGAGIGIDPVGLNFCHGVQNPFVFEAWEALPGFNSHHEERSGTYVEDCGGAGGNICYAINGAIDPVPGIIDFFGLFDLVAHEFGHCLTIGHVGDGAEGDWGPVPTNDIMAYHSDPPGKTKCVSTLDMESFAIRMSGYLDVNGDGAVNNADRLYANDHIGEGGNPFQIQPKDAHKYASLSGKATDCPQPDLGPLPGAERTQWNPDPSGPPPEEGTVTITTPEDGTSVEAGLVTVSGTASFVAPPADRDGDGVEDSADNCPDHPNADQTDSDGDGRGDACDSGFPEPDGTITGGITLFADNNPALAANELVSTGTGLAGDPAPKFLEGESVTFHSRFSDDSLGRVTVGTTMFSWAIFDEDGNQIDARDCVTSGDSNAATGPDGFDCESSFTMPAAGSYYTSAVSDFGVWIADDPADNNGRPGLKMFETVAAAAPASASTADPAGDTETGLADITGIAVTETVDGVDVTLGLADMSAVHGSFFYFSFDTVTWLGCTLWAPWDGSANAGAGTAFTADVAAGTVNLHVTTADLQGSAHPFAVSVTSHVGDCLTEVGTNEDTAPDSGTVDVNSGTPPPPSPVGTVLYMDSAGDEGAIDAFNGNPPFLTSDAPGGAGKTFTNPPGLGGVYPGTVWEPSFTHADGGFTLDGADVTVEWFAEVLGPATSGAVEQNWRVELWVDDGDGTWMSTNDGADPATNADMVATADLKSAAGAGVHAVSHTFEDVTTGNTGSLAVVITPVYLVDDGEVIVHYGGDDVQSRVIIDGSSGTDADGDGVPDGSDNCPNTANGDQTDTDGDGAGDACDGDDDNDGVPDGSDACPTQAGPASNNGCPEAGGERVQITADGKTVNALISSEAWSEQVDLSDSQGPVTITATWFDDDENVVDSDSITVTVNGIAVDSDGDGINDSVDNCPDDANPGQEDLDGDGAGDVCDADRDGDGVDNALDAFPDDATEWADSDGDGVGDNSDICPGHDDNADADGDGIPDGCDPPDDATISIDSPSEGSTVEGPVSFTGTFDTGAGSPTNGAIPDLAGVAGALAAQGIVWQPWMSDIHAALALHDGFLALLPGDDGVTAYFSGAGPKALPDVPAGHTLTVVTDAAPQPLALPLDAPVPLGEHAGILPGINWNEAISPGAQLYLDFDGNGFGEYICTSNFVWKGNDGKLYLGAAGHCFLPSTADATSNVGGSFDASSLRVFVCTANCVFGGYAGAFVEDFVVFEHQELGPVKYARQEGPLGDIGSDFGIVEIPESLYDLVDPAMPGWGGPFGMQTADNRNGDAVLLHGNGALVAETTATKTRAGVSLADGDANSWTAVLPINGGDSGSAVSMVSPWDEVPDIMAAGLVTHGLGIQDPVAGLGVPLGVGYGTTMPRAIEMAREAGVCIEPVLAGEDPVSKPAPASGPECQGGTGGGYAVEVSSDGSTWTTASVSGTSWSHTFDLPDGAYTLTARLLDDGAEVDRDSVSVTVTSPPPACVLENGVPRDVTLTAGDELQCLFDVPGGRTAANFTMTGPECEAEGVFCSGVDYDLYVRHGAQPTDADYDCRPYTTGNQEACDFADPAAGSWWARIDAFQGDGTVTVTASYSFEDADGDGVDDLFDICPGHDDNADLDSDGTPDGCDGDRDGDGVANEDDAFPDDGTRAGDSDGDGVDDLFDVCAGHDDDADLDSDGTPDGCDDDRDGDGVPNGDDAFPDDGTEWSDRDGDGVGDNSDAFPDDPSEWSDRDGDFVGDNSDAFPDDPSEWSDRDGDGVGDNADAFPNDASEWADSDGDGVGDNSDACAGHDDHADLDGDGMADGCDGDRDGDGVANGDDAFPDDGSRVGDSDGDGVDDLDDAFPDDGGEWADSDGDGVGDNSDAFPHDASESSDSDGDGVGDNSDVCPGHDDHMDADGDGIPDGCDEPESSHGGNMGNGDGEGPDCSKFEGKKNGKAPIMCRT